MSVSDTRNFAPFCALRPSRSGGAEMGYCRIEQGATMREPHFDNAIPDFVRMTTATELRAILAQVGYAGLREHYKMLWDDGIRPAQVISDDRNKQRTKLFKLLSARRRKNRVRQSGD
jgi:hypothetical protein